MVGPVVPQVTGAVNWSYLGKSFSGRINTVVNGAGGIKAFAGVREDPFFFDLEQFFNILPDRATPITGVPVPNPNTPQATTWRSPGTAVDFLSNGGYNVL